MKKNVLAGLLIIAILLCAGRLYAETSLSVSLLEGGTSTINFGDLNSSSIISKELKLKIDSDASSAYQIRQVIIQPPISREGTELGSDVLSFYTVRGSNALGSLYKTIREPLSFRDEVLYLSDSQGTSDLFKLVYVVDGKNLKTPGKFYGKIAYIIETKDGSTQTQVFGIELNAQTELDVNIAIPGANLRLATGSETQNLGYADFQIKGGLGNIEVYQSLESPLSNYKGTLLPEGAIKFYLTAESGANTDYSSPAPLENKNTLIYTSDRGTDVFRVNFILEQEKLKNSEAGIYKGTLSYLIRQNNREKTIPISIEIDAKKIFDMKISGDNLSFSIKPDNPPQEKMVLIEVQSNMRSAYQITQRMERPLTNSRGDIVPGKYFMMRQEIITGAGQVESGEFKPIEQKEETVFNSDDKGTDTTVRIIYRLLGAWDIAAGNYSASLTYSLSEK